MPEKKTLQRARRAKSQGKAATTQAGEFVREEMEHKKKGKHPVKSRKQAIAIGLSKARRSGVKVPRKGAAKSSARKPSSSKRAGTGAGGSQKSSGSRSGTTRRASSTRSSPRKASARKAPSRRASSRKTSSRKTSGARSRRKS